MKKSTYHFYDPNTGEFKFSKERITESEARKLAQGGKMIWEEV